MHGESLCRDAISSPKASEKVRVRLERAKDWTAILSHDDRQPRTISIFGAIMRGYDLPSHISGRPLRPMLMSSRQALVLSISVRPR